MLEKLLTLLSGNMILFKTALEKSDENLASQIKGFSSKIEEGNTKVVEEITALQSSIEKLATAIEKQPAFNVDVPEIKLPTITVPEVKLPEINVTVPEIKIPEIKLPTINVPPTQVTVEPNITVTPTPVVYPKEMTVKGVVEALKSILKALKETPAQQIYTTDNPLPVSFIDRKGGRYDLIHLGTPRSVGGGATPSEITGADKVLRTIPFDISATGTIIPAVSGRRIKVYAIKLTVDAPLSVAFRDGASTLLEGMQDYLANSGYIDNIQPPAYLMATTAGNSLDLVVTGTGNVSGRITYWNDDKI